MPIPQWRGEKEKNVSSSDPGWDNGFGTEADDSHSTDPWNDWGSTSGNFFD
jgi:hypothetical protein